MTRNRLKHILLGLASFILTALPASILVAEDWMDFASATGVYKVRMPEGYKASTMQFMIGDRRAVHSEETSSLLDQRPYKNTMKSYVVKFDQTLGPSLTQGDVAQLLTEEFKGYENYYRNLDGVVRSQSNTGFGNHWGGEILISYRDPTFGIQSIRARILFSETTKLQQIVVGSEDLMNSFQTRDFFDSLQLDMGVSVVDSTIRKNWNVMESPTGMFTLYYPSQEAPPYYTTEPTSKWDDKNEMVSVFFLDPVRNEKIFFNVYGYQFNKDLDFTSVQEVLTKRHILPQRGTTKAVKFGKGITDGDADGKNRLPFIDTTYGIKPLKDFPYVQATRLRAYFTGKNMLVIETMTSSALFLSPLIETFMANVGFQPGKIHAAAQPIAPSAAPAEPIDTTPEADVPAVPTHRPLGPIPGRPDIILESMPAPEPPPKDPPKDAKPADPAKP